MITANQIKALRALEGLNQTELARRVDVNPATISRIESGVHPLRGPLSKLLEKMYKEATEKHG